MKAPCKDCTDRHLKCHSNCDKYLAFRKEKDKIQDKRFIESEYSAMVSDMKLKLKKLHK